MAKRKRAPTASSRSSSRASSGGSLGGRIVRILFRTVIGFVALSLFFVVLYRFVPVPVTPTMLFDRNGITKDWVALSDIDPNMPRAAIAAEDSKFCHHHGFDADAITRAIQHNEDGGRIRGGSTISQQTAKNVFLWQGGGYVRKGFEAWFTLLIEAVWGKARIMEVYLNVAETGIGTYGVEAGSMRYFHHGAGRMTPAEAGRLAAILPLPKKRAAISPTGFTRRYGNIIARRIAVVRSQGLDACLK